MNLEASNNGWDWSTATSTSDPIFQAEDPRSWFPEETFEGRQLPAASPFS